MNKEEIILKIIEKIKKQDISKITFSNIREKNMELKKIIGKIILIKNKPHIQFEYIYKRIIKHKNIYILENDILIQELESLFLISKDINFKTSNEEISIKISKKLKINVNTKFKNNKIIVKQHNNEKKYILSAEKIYPFLIELSIQTSNGIIKKDKYNKFKQINKYLEFINDSIKHIDKKNKITIIDFGCGKSYLTFSLYYYLTDILNLDVDIFGIDLKKEVIDNCNNIAKKLNYNNLKFIYSDISNFNISQKIDMVISLHACDIATDIAILKAIKWKANSILAVPCCHKEVNKQINRNYLPIMLKHNIIKEKFSTLFTDSIRSEILDACSYKSDIVEFISEKNTPKNILIRAYKRDKFIDFDKINKIEEYLKSLDITMYLIDNIKKEMKN